MGVCLSVKEFKSRSLTLTSKSIKAPFFESVASDSDF